MSIAKMIITCTYAMLVMTDLSQAKGWHAIVPLHSTRADVEMLLGPPEESRGVASTYDTKNERVLVFYSTGSCTKDNWEVPRDTVLSFTVRPKAKLLVHALQLDKTKYDKSLDPHLQGIVYYVNKEEGVFVDARILPGGSEDVSSITYEPAAKDNDLRCPSSLKPSKDQTVYDPHIRKFDEYSDLLFSDEKARLDNFAIYLLKDEPTFKGYIIVYAGEGTRPGEAQARAQRAKDYLVKVRGIEAARIVTIDGGCREKLEVELYALPSSMSPPAPNQ